MHVKKCGPGPWACLIKLCEFLPRRSNALTLAARSTSCIQNVAFVVGTKQILEISSFDVQSNQWLTSDPRPAGTISARMLSVPRACCAPQASVLHLDGTHVTQRYTRAASGSGVLREKGVDASLRRVRVSSHNAHRQRIDDNAAQPLLCNAHFGGRCKQHLCQTLVNEVCQ